jgi:hypothetical protein
MLLGLMREASIYSDVKFSRRMWHIYLNGDEEKRGFIKVLGEQGILAISLEIEAMGNSYDLQQCGHIQDKGIAKFSPEPIACTSYPFQLPPPKLLMLLDEPFKLPRWPSSWNPRPQRHISVDFWFFPDPSSCPH